MDDRGQMGPTPLGPMFLMVAAIVGMLVVQEVSEAPAIAASIPTFHVSEAALIGANLTAFGGFFTDLAGKLYAMPYDLEGP